jgi:cytoskeleton protein RodZ
MLREARQAQGLHVAALAMMLKVAPRKLEALEADRHEELQGITFVRALAQAACRALKLDPAPVLARLPRPDQELLGQVSAGLNAPFRERGMKREAPDSLFGSRLLLGVVLVLCAAALALWLLPADALSQFGALIGRSAATAPVAQTEKVLLPAAPPAVAVMPPASSVLSTDLAPPRAAASAAAVPVLPAAALVQSSSSELSPQPAGVGRAALQLRTREASWIEVTDANSQVLLARVVAAGEDLALDATPPVRVKIGNARATELLLRGQTVDLLAQTRDNVARLELR